MRLKSSSVFQVFPVFLINVNQILQPGKPMVFENSAQCWEMLLHQMNQGTVIHSKGLLLCRRGDSVHAMLRTDQLHSVVQGKLTLPTLTQCNIMANVTAQEPSCVGDTSVIRSVYQWLGFSWWDKHEDVIACLNHIVSVRPGDRPALCENVLSFLRGKGDLPAAFKDDPHKNALEAVKGTKEGIFHWTVIFFLLCMIS